MQVRPALRLVSSPTYLHIEDTDDRQYNNCGEIHPGKERQLINTCRQEKEPEKAQVQRSRKKYAYYFRDSPVQNINSHDDRYNWKQIHTNSS